MGHRRDRRRNRRRRKYDPAQEKVKFFKHLTSYVIVNAAMLAVNALNGTYRNWLPVIIFWGIGLAFHYVKAFGFGSQGLGSKEWERKMLNKDKDQDFDDDEYLELKEMDKEPKRNWREEDLV
jgi:hypothetical protein